jgi:hypothetical protein
MAQTKSHVRIEYSLEIYKPQELMNIPGADECRYWHSLQPFAPVHVGDHISPVTWQFPSMNWDDLIVKMGGRKDIDPTWGIAVVESVVHNIREVLDDKAQPTGAVRHTVIVRTKMIDGR